MIEAYDSAWRQVCNDLVLCPSAFCFAGCCPFWTPGWTPRQKRRRRHRRAAYWPEREAMRTSARDVLLVRVRRASSRR